MNDSSTAENNAIPVPPNSKQVVPQRERPRRDFLTALERHLNDRHDSPTEAKNAMIGLAVKHRLLPYARQSGRSRLIIDAALRSFPHEFTKPQQLVNEFNYLRKQIPLVQDFSLKAFNDAKGTFTKSKWGDYRFSEALEKWQQETVGYLRQQLYMYVDEFDLVIRKIKDVESGKIRLEESRAGGIIVSSVEGGLVGIE